MDFGYSAIMIAGGESKGDFEAVLECSIDNGQGRVCRRILPSQTQCLNAIFSWLRCLRGLSIDAGNGDLG